jgi:hypothetical protein
MQAVFSGMAATLTAVSFHQPAGAMSYSLESRIINQWF